MRGERERLRRRAIAKQATAGDLVIPLIFTGGAAYLVGHFLNAWCAVLPLGFGLIAAIQFFDDLRTKRHLDDPLPPAPPTPELDGAPVWDRVNEHWTVHHLVLGEPVEIEFQDVAGAPAPREVALWNARREAIPSLWRKVIAAAQAWGRDALKTDFATEEFELLSVSFHPDQPFEGGELSFSFEVASDLNGSWFGTVQGEQVVTIHRDT